MKCTGYVVNDMGEADQIYSFVGSKIVLLQNNDPWAKGMLAKIRRGVGKDPSDTPDIWEITFGGIPESLSPIGSNIGTTKAELAIHTALTLYALHQQGSDVSVNAGGKGIERRSFSSACRRLISPDGRNEVAIKRRFDALITAGDITEFSYHARGLVQMMRASDVSISVDYPQFAKDLYFYQLPGQKQKVLLNWGRDFYRVISDEEKRDG